MRYLHPQRFSLSNGVVIVEACINSGVFHFVHEVARTAEVVRSMRDEAVHRELHIGCPEVASQNRRYRTGHTAMSRRVLGMSGRVGQGRPARIRNT